jgi:hypothetical protein
MLRKIGPVLRRKFAKISGSSPKKKKKLIMMMLMMMTGRRVLSGYAKVSPWNEIALSATMQRKKE